MHVSENFFENTFEYKTIDCVSSSIFFFKTTLQLCTRVASIDILIYLNCTLFNWLEKLAINYNIFQNI